ncbi:MAG TPA: sterol desaturase family protein [Xanthobacteraceae bacterium]|jgi:sterol desaturase/sphingolipid hydroxylase (fatty acid hydroxylase superfamily)|nr:sterol desaturase family protein [Xanthobacteraceae bacterium]
MYQSKWGYYADFVVYPVTAAGLAWVVSRGAHSEFLGVFLLSCLAGFAAWTLVEYLMHRFVFHAIPGIAQMHGRHHAAPAAFIGTPIWLSLGSFGLGGFLPLWPVAGFEIAGGATAGLMLGFTWYVAVHDAIHRRTLDRDSILYRAKLRHTCHHARHDGNYGVTTGFWDRMLGTAIDPTQRELKRARS